MTPSIRKRKKAKTGPLKEEVSKGKSKCKLQSIKKKRVKKYTERNYNNDQMNDAIKAVQKGHSVRNAANHFGVPKSTLHLNLTNPSRIRCKKGPPSVLSQKEEDDIVKWILHCAEKGFPVTKTRLLDCVQLYVKIAGKETPFKDNRPGKHWYNAFMKRHKNLSIRTAQNLTTSRASVSTDDLKQWFDRLKVYFQEENLLSLPPERIFNLDESAFRLVPPNDPVIAKKGSKSVYQIVSSNEKATLTVLFTANAAGQLLPPMMLFDLKSVPNKNILSSISKHWNVGNTDQGWMTAESFYGFITNVFYKWLVDNKYKFPVLLYVDGHSSHISLPLSQFCEEKKIELVTLFPNATHILQPLDVALFHVLKDSYKNTLTKWRIEHNVINMKKSMFAPVLQLALENKDYSDCIKNGFRTCGLFPFEPDAIDYNILNKNKTKSLNLQATDEPQDLQRNENKNLLDFFEKNILLTDILEAFKVDEFKETWSGDVKHLELFESWCKMKRLNDNVQEEGMRVQESIDNEVRSPILNNLEFVVDSTDSISNQSCEKNLDECAEDDLTVITKMEIDYPTRTVELEIIDENGQVSKVPVLVLESDSFQNKTINNNNEVTLLSDGYSNAADEYQDSIRDLSQNKCEVNYCRTDSSNKISTSTKENNLFEVNSKTSEQECSLLERTDKDSVYTDNSFDVNSNRGNIDEQSTISETVGDFTISSEMKDVFTVPNFKSNNKKQKCTTQVAVLKDLLTVLSKKEDEKKAKEAQVLINKQKREKIRQIKEQEQKIKKSLNKKSKENRLKLKKLKELLKSGRNNENKDQLEEQIHQLETELEEIKRLKLMQQMETLQSQIEIKQEK